MNGLGVYDFIIKEQYDHVTGETYEAMVACNNDEMADRCKVNSALKCVWCVKASADFNSNAATSLRANIKNGNVSFLINEFDAEDVVKKIGGYVKMSQSEQTRIMLPYVQTSLLVNEMINLEHEIVNNKVKLKERSGMRKDRFSSIEYNNAVVQILGTQLKPVNNERELVNMLRIRPSRHVSSFD